MAAHVAEHVRLNQARLNGEADWTRALLERIGDGERWFDGEPEPPWNNPSEETSPPTARL
ncbi:MAG: hypothetical protein ABI355_15695 [Solirubrobacteraceae bacterium]